MPNFSEKFDVFIRRSLTIDSQEYFLSQNIIMMSGGGLPIVIQILWKPSGLGHQIHVDKVN